MNLVIEYSAMVTGVIAAITVSANLGRRITGAAFIVFTVSSLLWVLSGIQEAEGALIIQNVVLTGVNLFGIYRWLIHKAPDGN